MIYAARFRWIIECSVSKRKDTNSQTFKKCNFTHPNHPFCVQVVHAASVGDRATVLAKSKDLKFLTGFEAKVKYFCLLLCSFIFDAIFFFFSSVLSGLHSFFFFLFLFVSDAVSLLSEWTVILLYHVCFAPVQYSSDTSSYPSTQNKDKCLNIACWWTRGTAGKS